MTHRISTLKIMFLVSLVAVLPFTAHHASAQNTALVNVPFGFQANHVYLPAGYYEVLSSDNTVTFINAKTCKAQAILLVRHEDGSEIETRGRLIFLVRGHDHVLKEVQFAGSSTHSELPVRTEKVREVAGVLQPTNTTIEIAMK
jgi:hypothetical protein